MNTRKLLVGAGGVASAGVAIAGGYVVLAWARYGRVDPGRRPDPVLDRFMPNPEVDECHTLRVRAPAAITFDVLRELDVMQSPLVRGIFWLRAIPTMLRGEPFRRMGPHGLLDETLAMGWGVLHESDRQIVVGAYTQPWHQEVTFHALPPAEFAAFERPGYVKIVWSVSAEPLADGHSLAVTRTRVSTNDALSRRKFRRYWAPMSSGIILIRYLSLPHARRLAELRADQQVLDPVATEVQPQAEIC